MRLFSADRWRADLAAVGVMLAAVWPLAIASLSQPWGRDQGIYAQAGARLLDGWIPYVDTFVFKPPVTIFVHAAAMGLFGRTVQAIRWFDVGWTTATVFVLFALGTRATGSRWFGALAGVLFALHYHQVGWWSSAQTDGWMALPVALALWLQLAGRGRGYRGLIGGLLVAVAFSFKYTALGVAPFVLILPLLRLGRDGWREAVGVVLGLGLGVGVLVGGLAAVGALDDFLSIQREVVFPYTGAGGKGLSKVSMATFAARLYRYMGTLLIPAGVGAVAWLVEAIYAIRRRSLDERVLAGIAALGWALSGLLSAYAQGKGFEYHMLMMEGGLALLFVMGVGSAARLLGYARGLGTLVVLYLAVQLARGPVPQRVEWIAQAALSGERFEIAVRKARFRTRDMSLNDNLDVADWVSAHTPPGEPIFVWAYDPMVYVLAERDMAGRFPYTYPLVVRWAPVERYRSELLSDLQSNPPSVVLVGARDAVSIVMGHKKDSRQTFDEFVGLRDWVGREYRVVHSVGRYQIWLREDLVE